MSGFNFDVITLFPKAFEMINNLGVITKALDKNLIDVNLHDLREYGEGSYRQVDDKPYGGGAGMVLKPEPIYKAYESIRKSPKNLTLLMTPQGKVLKQKDLVRWSTLDQIIIICGQYEGFDERIRCLADEEISTRKKSKKRNTEIKRRGYDKIFHESVLQADRGADFDFLRPVK